MNEKDRKLWDENIKMYAKATGKSKKEIQDSLSLQDMEVAINIQKAVHIIHSETLKSDRPRGQIMSAIGELIRPFPKEMQLEMLLDTIKKLDELQKFINLTGERKK